MRSFELVVKPEHNPCLRYMDDKFDDSRFANQQSEGVLGELAASLFRSVNLPVAEIVNALSEPPYFVKICGLPDEAPKTVLVAVSLGLGQLADPVNVPDGSRVREIVAATDCYDTGGQVLNEQLHTDGTDWKIPNDLTLLFCVASDDDGGRFNVLTINEVHQALMSTREGQELHQVLVRAPVPWMLSAAGGSSILRQPILGSGRMRWMRYTIDAALGHRSDPDVASVVEEFDRVIKAARAEAHVYDFSPGDLLIVNNRCCLHGRTPINLLTSQRLLLRTKVYGGLSESPWQ